MRLSGLSLTVVLLFASFALAQHSSGGSSSSGSSSSGSSGGGSHSSSSGGSSYSGGSHSSGGGSSYSGGGSSHSSTSSHGSGIVHPSGGVSVSSGSGSHSKNEHGSSLVNSRNGIESSPSKVRPIHEPKSGVPQRAVVPEKRSFFTFLRHPFRKPPPKVVALPALYLPRPVCRKGKCAPACPVGQVSSGGVCSTPAVQLVRCGPDVESLLPRPMFPCRNLERRFLPLPHPVPGQLLRAPHSLGSSGTAGTGCGGGSPQCLCQWPCAGMFRRDQHLADRREPAPQSARPLSAMPVPVHVDVLGAIPAVPV